MDKKVKNLESQQDKLQQMEIWSNQIERHWNNRITNNHNDEEDSKMESTTATDNEHDMDREIVDPVSSFNFWFWNEYKRIQTHETNPFKFFNRTNACNELVKKGIRWNQHQFIFISDLFDFILFMKKSTTETRIK
jgi:hypothetical protein